MKEENQRLVDSKIRIMCQGAAACLPCLKYISNFILGDINYIFRSEKLLFSIKGAIVQLYYGEKKLTFL
jgi:hypothetical protein